MPKRSVASNNSSLVFFFFLSCVGCNNFFRHQPSWVCFSFISYCPILRLKKIPFLPPYKYRISISLKLVQLNLKLQHHKSTLSSITRKRCWTRHPKFAVLDLNHMNVLPVWALIPMPIQLLDTAGLQVTDWLTRLFRDDWLAAGLWKLISSDRERHKSIKA